MPHTPYAIRDLLGSPLSAKNGHCQTIGSDKIRLWHIRMGGVISFLTRAEEQLCWRRRIPLVSQPMPHLSPLHWSSLITASDRGVPQAETDSMLNRKENVADAPKLPRERQAECLHFCRQFLLD